MRERFLLWLRCFSGQFVSAFPQEMSSNTSNPFQRGNPWGQNGNTTVVANNFQQGFGANPFRTDSFNGKFNGMTNGFNGNQMTTQPFQQNIFSSQPMKAWNAPNPFSVSNETNIGEKMKSFKIF